MECANAIQKIRIKFNFVEEMAASHRIFARVNVNRFSKKLFQKIAFFLLHFFATHLLKCNFERRFRNALDEGGRGLIEFKSH